MSPEFQTYFATFPKETQRVLREMYDIIKAVLPETKRGLFCSIQKSYWVLSNRFGGEGF